MDLTGEQRKNLELYRRYRDSAPSFWQLLWANSPRYFLFVLLVLLLYVLAPLAGMASVPLVVTGLFLGVLGRDIGRFLQFIRVWPATAAVIDWTRLEALLGDG